jgi:hypothetical protein
MKKIVITLLVLTVCLAAAQASIAAEPKPPSVICLNAEGTGEFTTLSIRPTSKTIKRSDGQFKIYSVDAIAQTSVSAIPCTGTGYMAGSTFIFSAVGSSTTTSGPWEVHQLYLGGRLSPQTKWLIWKNAHIEGVFRDLKEVPCSSVPVPK